jgi:putative DNA primase/helicase
MSIFLDNAPLYWGVGLPVMPLKRWNSIGKGAGKAPILAEWTQYGEHMPSRAMRDHWLQSYPDSNIGLPFGVASGLCAIDIDTEDPDIIAAIRGCLPASPWVRVGKKGMGLIYKWQGQSNFKLRDSENQSIVEFLGKGNQMVLPPSIHPDTGKPYVSDNHLYEVMDRIAPLPVDIENVLRLALEPVMGTRGLSLAQSGRSGPLQVIPEGTRDIEMIRRAGYYARVVLGIDRTEDFSLLQAMNHMEAWVLDYTSRVSGDDMDPAKGVGKLLEFLLKDVEGGKTLPNGWDDGLTEDQRSHPAIAEMIKRNEIQRWTYQKAISWLEAKFAEQPDDVDYAITKVIELVGLLAKDEHFGEFEFKQIAGQLKAMTGRAWSKADLVKMFKDARSGEDQQADDQEAIAQQVYDLISRGGELIYSLEQFWQWDGACYKHLDDEFVVKTVASEIKGNKLAKRYNDYTSIMRTIALIARGDLVKDFEPGINFANGYLTTDLKLQDHSPKFGKTFVMPFNYIEQRAGEAHKWLQFLEDCWGDDIDYAEKVAGLQEAFAATMFGMAWRYQSAFLLYGPGGTGKTQVLEVLRSMMPENARSSVPPTKWGERFQQAPMVNKALNICGELPEASVIDGDVFKEIIEGGEMQTEFKGKPLFTYRPTAAQWFASNFLPRSRDTSEGFTRRWTIFWFQKQIPASKRILNFHEVLINEEREAIAAWAVQAYPRLVKARAYTRSASHEKLLSLVRRTNNSVVAFLDSSDKVRPDENTRTDIRAIYDHYTLYMKDISRGYGVHFERFRQMLLDLGYRLEPYRDGVGAAREEVYGLKVLNMILPDPRVGANFMENPQIPQK